VEVHKQKKAYLLKRILHVERVSAYKVFVAGILYMIYSTKCETPFQQWKSICISCESGTLIFCILSNKY